ncbi:MAG: hypothetical protein IIC76_06730 [Bacteroidetes bacterium]|nr:hypothetical protein [Bacteroidota bacterium]
MIDDEKKYNEVIKTLKGLQQLKASPNFEADLKRRLNAEKYVKEEKRKIKRFFTPSRLVPSFGLAAAAIVILLMVNTNSEEADNPFLMEPKIREDIMLVSDKNEAVIPEDNLNEKSDVAEKDVFTDKINSGVRSEKLLKERSSDNDLFAGREFSPSESTLTAETEITITDEVSAPLATGIAIRKSGLNFRQVYPTKEEKKEILELKKKIRFPKKIEKLE